MILLPELKRAILVGALALAWPLLSPLAVLGQESFEIVPTWDGIKKCSGTPVASPSPAFTHANVPKGTATLEFRMVDLDAPHFNHGGGRVGYAGSSKIAPGAFQFIGPCPPSTHRYEWTVTAFNARGVRLAFARAVETYP